MTSESSLPNLGAKIKINKVFKYGHIIHRWKENFMLKVSLELASGNEVTDVRMLFILGVDPLSKTKYL